MRRFLMRAGLLAAVAVAAAGCGEGRKTANLSGKVTFRGNPVPEGFINFMPDVPAGNTGEVKAFPIKNGVYNTADGSNPGIYPGANKVRISGFDGHGKTGFPQGVQVFNAFEENLSVAEGNNTKDFVVPESAGQNVKIFSYSDHK